MSDDEKKTIPTLKGTVHPATTGALPSSSRFEKGLAIANGAAQAAGAIPGAALVTGPLSVVLSEFQGHAQEKRFEEWVGALNEELKNRLTSLEALESRRQEQVYRLVLEARISSDNEKLNRLRRAVLALVAPSANQIDELVAQSVLLITDLEAQVIDAFYDLPEAARDMRTSHFGFYVLERIFETLDPEVLRAVVERLISFGLIRDVGVDDTIFGVSKLVALERTVLGNTLALLLH